MYIHICAHTQTHKLWDVVKDKLRALDVYFRVKKTLNMNELNVQFMKEK